MAKRTPLYEEHLRLGGKIVEFGGWELPVQYLAGIKAEHLAVRKDCGLSDVSHIQLTHGLLLKHDQQVPLYLQGLQKQFCLL